MFAQKKFSYFRTFDLEDIFAALRNKICDEVCEDLFVIAEKLVLAARGRAN